MRHTADVTGSKPLAVLLQSISGVSGINPLVAFYDIHGGKREVLLFYFVPDTTQDYTIKIMKLINSRVNEWLVSVAHFANKQSLSPLSRTRDTKDP
jgi:hypothetical protein